MACPTPKLCLATGNDSGALGISIDPSAARSWARLQLEPDSSPIFGVSLRVSCAPANLCVAFDNRAAFVLTDPAGPAVRAAKARLSRASLTGVGTRRPRLALSVAAGIPPGRAIQSVAIRLPHGISFSRRKRLLGAIVVTGAHGRHPRFGLDLRGGAVSIELARPASSIRIGIGSSGMRASERLAQEVERRKVRTLTLLLKVADAGRGMTALRPKLKAS